MVKVSVLYTGDKHCDLVHGPSASKIETDAPVDNQGRGERFSPTDLVGAALSSCVLTVMAIAAEREGVSMKGTHAEIEKEMQTTPRRISSLRMRIDFCSGIPKAFRPKLEAAAHACPVKKSIHPEIETPIVFNYPD